MTIGISTSLIACQVMDKGANSGSGKSLSWNDLSLPSLGLEYLGILHAAFVYVNEFFSVESRKNFACRKQY